MNQDPHDPPTRESDARDVASFQESIPLDDAARGHGSDAADVRRAPALYINAAKRPLHSGGQADVHVGVLNGMPVMFKAFNKKEHAARELNVHHEVTQACSARELALFVPSHHTFMCPTSPLITPLEGKACAANELCLMDMHELLTPLWQQHDDTQSTRAVRGVAKALSGDVGVRRLLRQVTRGVAHMHARGIAHNDLKLCNVFITTQDRCRVLSASSIACSDLQANDSVAERCLAHALQHNMTCAVQSPREGRQPLNTNEGTVMSRVHAAMRGAVLDVVTAAGTVDAPLPRSWFSPRARLQACVSDMGLAHVAQLGYMPTRRGLYVVSNSQTAPELMHAVLRRAHTGEDKAGAVVLGEGPEPLDSDAFDELSMDVYALGVLVYSAVTGTLPYRSPRPDTPRFRAFMHALHGPEAHLLHKCMQPHRKEWRTPVPSTYETTLKAMTPECRQFLRACMHPNPARRLHAAMLLQLPFLQAHTADTQ